MNTQRMTQYSIFLTVTVFLLACQPKPIPIELEQAEPKLVVNSQFFPELNSVLVVLTKSFSALDNYAGEGGSADLNIEDFLVKGAEVTISYNGETETLLQYEDAPGFYIAVGISQEVGTVYELNAYDPVSKLKIRATTTLLKTISLDTVNAKRILGDFSDTIVNIHIGFDDPVNEDNWYMVNFYKLETDTVADTTQNNPFLNDLSSTYTAIFSDKMFDNEHISQDFEMWWYGDTITASLYNISEDYYSYLQARNKGDGMLASITSEPINHPTNVVDGYGFFNAHFPDIKIVFTEE